VKGKKLKQAILTSFELLDYDELNELSLAFKLAFQQEPEVKVDYISRLRNCTQNQKRKRIRAISDILLIGDFVVATLHQISGFINKSQSEISLSSVLLSASERPFSKKEVIDIADKLSQNFNTTIRAKEIHKRDYSREKFYELIDKDARYLKLYNLLHEDSHEKITVLAYRGVPIIDIGSFVEFLMKKKQDLPNKEKTIEHFRQIFEKEEFYAYKSEIDLSACILLYELVRKINSMLSSISGGIDIDEIKLKDYLLEKKLLKDRKGLVAFQKRLEKELTLRLKDRKIRTTTSVCDVILWSFKVKLAKIFGEEALREEMQPVGNMKNMQREEIDHLIDDVFATAIKENKYSEAKKYLEGLCSQFDPEMFTEIMKTVTLKHRDKENIEFDLCLFSLWSSFPTHYSYMLNKFLKSEDSALNNYSRFLLEQQEYLNEQLRGGEIGAKFSDLIVEQLGVNKDEVEMDASFIDDLGADSLDTVELIMALEEEFDIEITDEEAENMRTVGEVINYLKRRIAEDGK
jgi:acyl carrier protein